MDTSIYYGYLSDDEREMALQEAEENLMFHKLDTLYETIEMNLQIMKETAELKVFKEGGTYEDLAYLYEEAEKEAEQKKGGVIHTIIEAIRSIWRSITGAIGGIFSSKDVSDEEEVEIPEGAEEDAKQLVSTWQKIKGMLKGFVGVAAATTVIDGFKNFVWPKLKTAFTEENNTAIKYIKVPYKKAKEIYNHVTGVQKEVDTELANVDNDKANSEDNKKPVTQILKNLAEKFKEFVTNLGTKLKETITGKKKEGEPVNPDAKDGQEGNGDQNGNDDDGNQGDGKSGEGNNSQGSGDNKGGAQPDNKSGNGNQQSNSGNQPASNGASGNAGKKEEPAQGNQGNSNGTQQVNQTPQQGQTANQGQKPTDTSGGNQGQNPDQNPGNNQPQAQSSGQNQGNTQTTGTNSQNNSGNQQPVKKMGKPINWGGPGKKRANGRQGLPKGNLRKAGYKPIQTGRAKQKDGTEAKFYQLNDPDGTWVVSSRRGDLWLQATPEEVQNMQITNESVDDFFDLHTDGFVDHFFEDTDINVDMDEVYEYAYADFLSL